MLFLKATFYTLLLLCGIVASVSFAAIYPQYALYYFATLSSLSALGLLISIVGWAYYRQHLSNPFVLIPLLLAAAYTSITAIVPHISPPQLASLFFVLLIAYAQLQHLRTSRRT